MHQDKRHEGKIFAQRSEKVKVRVTGHEGHEKLLLCDNLV